MGGERYADSRSMPPSVSIIVPCRNEAGNIPRILPAIPSFGAETEVIFVEGHSTDDTWTRLQSLPQTVDGRSVRIVQQQGIGKADAVHLGFSLARNDILIILDADMTVDPACLGEFYTCIASGRADVAIGTRLVLSMEEGSMPLPNRLANRFFAFLLGIVLRQRFTDTLCGTKAFRRTDHARILTASGVMGSRDPFGDYWILVGAANAGLRILEIPVRYFRRRYGKSNIRHVREGLLLLRLTLMAATVSRSTTTH